MDSINAIMKKEVISKAFAQVSTIFLTAAIAAGLTFLQSLIAQSGLCPEPITDIEKAAFLGGALRAGHSFFTTAIKTS